MSEYPLPLSATMVQALLAGRKTQDRPLVALNSHVGLESDHAPWRFCEFHDDPRSAVWQHRTDIRRVITETCPYGVPGDRLWVQEAFRITEFWPADGVDDWGATFEYPADGAKRFVYQCDAPGDVGMWPGAAIRKQGGILQAASAMPRWATRIMLELLDVRIQQVQQISNADARAEGVDAAPHRGPHGGPCIFKTGFEQCYGCAFRMQWNQLHGPEGFGWDRNPWVWALTFRRIETMGLADAA